MFAEIATGLYWFAQAVEVVFSIGLTAAVVTAAGLAIADKMQTEDPVRNSMPLLGRFIPVMNWAGEIIRSRITAQERENKPVNRNQMRQVAEMARNGKPAISAFGSSKDLQKAGTFVFIPGMYPVLEDEAERPQPVVIGSQCEHPYTARSKFNFSAISAGAAGDPFIEALGKAAKKVGCWVNTGEGGLADVHTKHGNDLVFQIGTAKFGVRTPDGKLDDDKLREVAKAADMFEIKLAQGAKAGKGGILPGEKVTEEVAARRGIPFGQNAISPNRHTDIANDAQLIDFIDHVREVTDKPVGIKIVPSHRKFMESLCQEIVKRGIEHAPDFITVDGGEGGSGAAPTIFMDSMGVSIHESLPMVTEILNKYRLKDRIKIIASGGLITPDLAAWALANGADLVNSIKGPMLAAGCVASGACNKNDCVAKLATQKPELLRDFNVAVQATHIANYVQAMNLGMEWIAHAAGEKSSSGLRPKHLRKVAAPGAESVPLDELRPGLNW